MKTLRAVMIGLAICALGRPAAASQPSPTATAALTLHLAGPADLAFSMFDPIHESLWDPGWKPRFFGAATVASGLVFTTAARGGRQSVWLLDRYDRATRTMRYVRVVNGRALTQLDIIVTPRGAGASEATVVHVETALDPAVTGEVQAAGRAFGSAGPHWEAAINAALRRAR